LRFSLVGDNNESLDIDTRSYTLRSDLAWQRQKHRVRAGFEAYRSETRGFVSAYAAILNLRLSNSALNLVDQKERYTVHLDRVRNYAALYVQDSWQWSKTVELGTGLRYEHDTLARQGLWSPRLSVAVRPHPRWNVRTTLVVYHTLRNTPMEVQPTRSGRPLRAERATEATVGISGRWAEPLRFGVTGWAKDFTSLVYEAEPAYYQNGGVGRSHGVETWLEFAPRRSALRASLQYAWSSVRHRDPVAWRRQWSEDPHTGERVWGPLFEEPYWYSPLQDQRHRFGLETRLRAGAWELGAHLQLASGLPYTPIESLQLDDEGNVYGIVGRKGSARLPDYGRLDLRAERSFQGSKLRWRVYAEILNVTAANNVYMTRWNRGYTQQYSVTMLPFLPTLGVEASF
jgi:outer membrane receptor protein involved in Fe transport